MHFFLFFILLVVLLSRVDCRPSRLLEANERESRDAEYEGENDAVAEEYAQEEQEGQGDDREEMRYEQQRQKDDGCLKSNDMKRNIQTRLESNKFSDYKNGREINEENEPNVNLEDNVAIPSSGHKLNVYKQSYEGNNNQPVKVIAQDEEAEPKQSDMYYHSRANEEGEILFKNGPNQKETDSFRYNNESPMIDEHPRSNEYYNSMHISNKRIRDEKRYDNSQNVERDRRQVQNNDEKQVDVLNNTPNEQESNAATAIEDGETAIKNKIKKLSKEDLEDLLNSLSEDKKSILRKVIDDKDIPNKREITKKAGAIEDNSFIENSQIDVRNLQPECSSESNLDITASQGSGATGAGSNENSDSSSTKVPDTEKNSEKTNSNNQLSEINPNENKRDTDTSDTRVDVKNEDNISDSSKDSTKKDDKRETNSKQLLRKEPLSIDNDKLKTDYQESLEQSGICNNNENYAYLENDEMQPEIKTDSKRETEEIQNNPEDSIKSLQDSFPTENEEPNLNSDLAPLVRVKRTDQSHLDKKRDTNSMSNVKVPYFPNIENENLENERSEFEDYGFFDRESHFAGNEKFEDTDKSNVDASLRQRRFKSNDGYLSKENSKLRNFNPDVDGMSLGSDTDSVLTGVEGVDENIMFNSGSRNKRAVKHMKIMTEDAKARIGRTTGPLEMNPIYENNINNHGLKEDDAFGPLPRNYEGDIDRFKRVREIKQS